MALREPVVVAFVAVAPAFGYGTAVLVDVVGWSPLLAPASALVLVAAFGWMRRGYDGVEVFATSLAVSYAAFVGLALARVSQSDAIMAQWQLAPRVLWQLAPLPALWPVILLGGVAFALVLAVCVAVPVSMVAPRRRPELGDHERFWAFVHEQNAIRARQPDRSDAGRRP